MQLLYFAVPLIVAGIALIALAGPLGILPLAIGVVLVVTRLKNGGRNDDAPHTPGEQNPLDGPGLGYAHLGQRAHPKPE